MARGHSIIVAHPLQVNYDEAYRARCQAICPWTIAQPKPDVLVVEDMHKDPQFRHFPLAVDGPLRFYAGAPIVTTDGLNLGTLCIVDTQPRTFTREDCRLLANFTEIVRAEMERDRICALAVESERARQAESFTSRLCRALDALSEAMVRRRWHRARRHPGVTPSFCPPKTVHAPPSPAAPGRHLAPRLARAVLKHRVRGPLPHGPGRGQPPGRVPATDQP